MNNDVYNLSDLFKSNKKSLLLRGPLLTQSGYGVHARQLASWALSKQNLSVTVQALPWGDTPWIVDRDRQGGLIGSIMDRTEEFGSKQFDASIQIQLPNEWDPRLAKYNVGVTAAVETDVCNPAWVTACNQMSLVIVPSEHAKKCLTSSGTITTPIEVIPEAYGKEYVEDAKTHIDEMKFSTDFNFLIVGQLTGNNPENDRKNIFYTIKWFCEVFRDDKDVGLVIKTNMGRNTKIDRRLVTDLMQNLLKEVRRSSLPKVHLIHGELSDREMASLYRHPQIKALLSLTRGEGYGLPILEAAANELPVIATGWSGHTEFLSHGKYIDVAYKLDRIHSSRADGKIFMPHARWAHPIEDDFKKKIVKFKSSPSIPKDWARSLKTAIHQKYSLEAICESYDRALGSIFQ